MTVKFWRGKELEKVIENLVLKILLSITASSGLVERMFSFRNLRSALQTKQTFIDEFGNIAFSE